MTTSKKIDKSLLHAHENLYLTTCATLKELGCQKKFDIPSRQSSRGHVRKKNRFSKKKIYIPSRQSSRRNVRMKIKKKFTMKFKKTIDMPSRQSLQAHANLHWDEIE